MKRRVITCLLSSFLLCGILSNANAQDSTEQMQSAPPAPELAILKHEEGKWDAAIKFWLPGGPTEPMESTGSEINTMVGEYWLSTQLDYEVMGQKYGGHGVFGFDSEKKRYVGTWYSSDSPNPIQMTGKWDEESKTVTYEMDGIDGMGNPLKGKIMNTYIDASSKKFEMHMDMGDGNMHKMMEIMYSKK